jgi:hypothetical protein
VKFGERGKSSGRHSLTSTVKRGLTVSLTKGWLRVCVGLVKGFIGGSLAGFSGDDPGWPRFDRGLTGLTRLIRSLALTTVIKKLGRHRSLENLSAGGWLKRPPALGFYAGGWTTASTETICAGTRSLAGAPPASKDPFYPPAQIVCGLVRHIFKNGGSTWK